MKCILYKLLDFVFLFSFYFFPKFNKFTSCRFFTATPLLITDELSSASGKMSSAPAYMSSAPDKMSSAPDKISRALSRCVF